MSRNVSQKPGLTARQVRAIAALVEEPTVTAAAGKAGVTAKTMFRWLNDPAFSDAYRAARGRLMEDVLTSLQAASVEAVKVLVNVMTDTNVAASVRASASRAVLELELKARQTLEYEERFAALEAGLTAITPSPTRRMG